MEPDMGSGYLALRDQLRELLRDNGKVQFTDRMLDTALSVVYDKLTPSNAADIQSIDWHKVISKKRTLLLDSTVEYLKCISSRNDQQELELIALLQIREAIGDPHGRLMQDEVVERIREAFKKNLELRDMRDDLQKRNTELVLKNREFKEMLERILDEYPEPQEPTGPCPVCSTYRHKHWCWYNEAQKLVGR